MDQTMTQKKSEIGESMNTKKYRMKNPNGRTKFEASTTSRGRKGSKMPKPSKPGMGSRLIKMEVTCKKPRNAIAIKNSSDAYWNKKENGITLNGRASKITSRRFAKGPAADTRLR